VSSRGVTHVKFCLILPKIGDCPFPLHCDHSFDAVFCKISSFDLRQIQPTPKSPKIKVEIGFWLHSNKTSFDLDLYPCLGPVCSVHIRCSARASGLAGVSVRCAAARQERRAAAALQSGGRRRPARLAVRPAVGTARRRQIGRAAGRASSPRSIWLFTESEQSSWIEFFNRILWALVHKAMLVSNVVCV
jgi:hypothetical protein